MGYVVYAGESTSQQEVAEHGGHMLHREGTLGIWSDSPSKIALLTPSVPDRHKHLLPK